MHEIGVRHVAQIAGFSFNMDTLYMTWLAMAVVIVIAILATRSLNVIPKGWQNVLEIIITGLQSKIDATMGERGKLVAPLLISLFMFILTSNWLGMIPTLSSPTSDLNTTLGLALMIVCMVHVLGLYFKGFSYIKHFFQPFAPFVIINLIEELAKPITLAFRLFGNILAGEILIIILLMLVPIWMPIPSVIWLAFSLFVGGVQAFIFTMLSMAYLASAVKQDNH